jgi:hypothetical protein
MCKKLNPFSTPRRKITMFLTRNSRRERHAKTKRFSILKGLWALFKT